jgi:hypothetical protein
MRMKADVGPDRDTTMIDGSLRELLVNLARSAVVTVATHSSHREDDRLRHLKIFCFLPMPRRRLRHTGAETAQDG